MISSLSSLQFLDISYSKKVTDVGMAYFSNKKIPINTLVINSCLGISSNGASILISACSETLLDFEAAFNSQPEMKSDLFSKLAVCWNLQSLDVTGCIQISDQAFGLLAKGEV